jgi:hypothetical protein
MIATLVSRGQYKQLIMNNMHSTSCSSMRSSASHGQAQYTVSCDNRHYRAQSQSIHRHCFITVTVDHHGSTPFIIPHAANNVHWFRRLATLVRMQNMLYAQNSFTSQCKTCLVIYLDKQHRRNDPLQQTNASTVMPPCIHD